jgi:hypothetical protein
MIGTLPTESNLKMLRSIKEDVARLEAAADLEITSQAVADRPFLEAPRYPYYERGITFDDGPFLIESQIGPS